MQRQLGLGSGFWWRYGLARGKPPIGKKVADLVGRMVLDAWQYVGEVFLGIDAKLGAGGDQAHDDGKVLAAFLVADE